jgi:hypothetical protein
LRQSERYGKRQRWPLAIVRERVSEGWRAGEGEERVSCDFWFREAKRERERVFDKRSRGRKSKRERERGWGTSAYRGERDSFVFLFISRQPRTFHVNQKIKFGKIFKTRSSFLAYKYKLNSAFHTYPQIQQKTSLSQFLLR